MTEPENLMLEHLRAIRGETAKLVDAMRSMSVEMTSMRQHLAGVMTLQEHDHGEVAMIKHRLDRIELRLELTE